jgi:hypothetical protein
VSQSPQASLLFASIPFSLQPSSTITLPKGDKVLMGACMLQKGATYRQIIIPAGSEVGADLAVGALGVCTWQPKLVWAANN